MLVIIKSSPRSEEAQAGLSLAKETSSNVVLLQNGVYLARQKALEGITGTVYAIDDDLSLRGAGARAGDVKPLGYDEFVDLMAEEKVVGMF